MEIALCTLIMDIISSKAITLIAEMIRNGMFLERDGRRVTAEQNFTSRGRDFRLIVRGIVDAHGMHGIPIICSTPSGSMCILLDITEMLDLSGHLSQVGLAIMEITTSSELIEQISGVVSDGIS